jgi:hypothetical protein
LGGPVLTLSDAVGGAIAITNDYTFGIAPNGISAKLVFTSQYDDTVDYLSYTVLGETWPIQYGYTIPETEIFTATAGQTQFNLVNYVSGDNPTNAVIEINGIRLTSSEYSINASTDILTLTTGALLNDVVAVTSYNVTGQQYFNTQYGITGNTVADIIDIDNEITSPILETTVTATTVTTNLLTCPDSSGLIVDQTIIFKGTSFGNVLTDGTVYYVKSVTFPYDGTFTISQTLGGSTYTLISGSGNMLAYVGGVPAVRVTTGINHNLVTNDIVRIDGTNGSTQLNNNTYYVHVINATQVDLYNSSYSASLSAVNDPVLNISSYTSGGYIWQNEIFVVNNNFDQDNVDRLWVTINGYRVPSSSLYINANNNLSILVSIISGDEIIITSMVPSATPNQLVYLENVNKNGYGSVYRANTNTKSWLVEPLNYTDETIYVADVSRVTDTIIQNVVAPAQVDGITSIGLTGDKRIISQIIVYNTTTSSYVDPSNYSVVIIDLSPILQITAQVSTGNNLVITTIIGNLLYINGEQIKFTTVDLDANSITGLQRGANGTGEITYIPVYAEVYGILSTNLLSNVNYNLTWNSNVFNEIEGDPLQISETVAAYFLNTDIS